MSAIPDSNSWLNSREPTFADCFAAVEQRFAEMELDELSQDLCNQPTANLINKFASNNFLDDYERQLVLDILIGREDTYDAPGPLNGFIVEVNDLVRSI